MIRKNVNTSSMEGFFSLSRAKAKQRLKREGYPSPDQIIQCARSKIDWPDERWDEIRRAADTAEKPEVRISNNKTVFAHIWQRHRRFAVVSSLVLVLAALLVCIPESRAFAIQAYHSVIRLFDNRLELQQPIQTDAGREHDNQIANDFASELENEQSQRHEMRTFTSLQEFEKATGHVPYCLNAPDIIYEISKFLKNRRNEEWLDTYYTCGDGLIVTTQVWNITSDISVLTNDSYQLYTTNTGNEVYYNTDKIDGSVYALAQLSDSILMVSANSIVHLERILQIFE